MGKFKYSMQNILDIKIKLETQAKNEFSEANRAYLIEKEKLEELFKKRAVYEAALKEQLSGSLNISEINICKKNPCGNFNPHGFYNCKESGGYAGG